MSDNDEKITNTLGSALEAKSAGPQPGFDETWLAAEARFLESKRRYRKFTSVAVAATLAAIVLVMLPADEGADLPEFEIVADLMDSTYWTAPSDALMPESSIDVYDHLLLLPVSTELYEGTLL